MSDIGRYLMPQLVLGIGGFAEKRARAVFDEATPVHAVLHPSPASPVANRGWADQLERQLADLGVPLP